MWKVRGSVGALGAVAAGVATALFLGGIALLWDQARAREFRAHVRYETTLTASEVRARLETALSSRLFVTSSVADYVGRNPNAAKADYDRVAALYVDGLPGIRDVELVRDGNVSRIFPRARDPAAVADDAFDIPLPGGATPHSAADGVHGPAHDFAWDGRAIISRMPVFVSRAEGNYGIGDYWGLVMVDVDVQSLLDEARLPDTVVTPAGRRIQLAIRGLNANGEPGAVLFGSPHVFDADPLLMDLTRPSSPWQLGAIPSRGWDALHPWASTRRAISFSIVFATSLLAFFLVRSLNRLRAEVAARTRTEVILRARSDELSEALAQVQTLRGLLPICARCKKIRDDRGYWNNIERYVEKHSMAVFSHGLCPECADELYGAEPWYQPMRSLTVEPSLPEQDRELPPRS